MGTEAPIALLDPLQLGLPAFEADTLSGSASFDLPSRHEAVRDARDFTRRTLQRWEVSRDLDEIALVVSELVTNALRHGLDHRSGTAEFGHDRHPTAQPVRLQLMRWSARLVCAVRDPSEEAPEAAPCPAETGRDDGPTSQGSGVEAEELRALTEFGDADALLTCPGIAAESGRGLFLVNAYSDGWGWRRLTGPHPGKVVWAVFRFSARW